MAKVYVSQTKKLGMGLFAKSNIRKDEILFIAKGVVVNDTYEEDYQLGPNWLTIKENLWLSPFEDNPWRYINHSCRPNAGLRGKVTVVAMDDIEKGEEVTIDYSITEDDPYWRMTCTCGLPECRGIIKSIRFLSLELYRKYEPYVPKFLRQAYERHACEPKPAFILKDSKVGKSVFAGQDFKKGEALFQFRGRLYPFEELPNPYDRVADRFVQIGENQFLGHLSGTDDDWDDLFNHSCDPNAGLKIQSPAIAEREREREREVLLVAIKEIKKAMKSPGTIRPPCTATIGKWTVNAEVKIAGNAYGSSNICRRMCSKDISTPASSRNTTCGISKRGWPFCMSSDARKCGDTSLANLAA